MTRHSVLVTYLRMERVGSRRHYKHRRVRWEVWTHEIGEATAKRRFPRVFVENRFGSLCP